MYKNKEYDIGYYNPDAKFRKEWTPSDYLIHNQTIIKSKYSDYPLVPFTAKKNIMAKYLLYALFDLKQNNHSKVNFITIKNQILNNKEKYDYFIWKRISLMTKRIIESTFQTSPILRNADFNQQTMLNKRMSSNRIKFEKNSKILNDDLYFSLALLLGTLIDMEYKVRTESRKYCSVIDKRPNDKLYYLSSEGIRLMNMHIKENFLL